MQEYEEWMKKKEPRRSSDDCHTPADVYEVVADWVSEEYHIPCEKMCRPFFPGGDFEAFDYTGKVVVDNPPFSILSKIIRFYTKNNVKFFLFAPALTSFSSDLYFNTCHIFIGNDIVYDNRARVLTCFLTNLDEETIARPAQDLREKIKKCESQHITRKKPKINLGHDTFTGAKLNTLVKKGIDYNFKRSSCERVRKTKSGQLIYGGGIRIRGRL